MQIRSPVPGFAVCAIALSVVGVFSLWPTCLSLWALWQTDPLKSIGVFVPLVSLVLILRVWRALDWELAGSWWGLPILPCTLAAVHLRDHTMLELVLSPSWTMVLPPHSLVALAYVSGTVLLFGGHRLYRAALFPILLIFLVNPVPHAFSRAIDLPLQHISATTARTLAQILGQHLMPDQLSLMFTPQFGMFIAPGCDGIRGSVTMGLLALVAGYLYQFRSRVWALAVMGAVLLGYAFNLLRLCALVVYYTIALHVPCLQSRAEMGDYLIGGALFFLATLLLFEVIRRCSATGDLRPPPLMLLREGGADWQSPRPVLSANRLRLLAFALVAGLGSVPYARGLVHPAAPVPDQAIFPERMGNYHLRRTWQERLSTGETIFEWAEYAVPTLAPVVAVGVSPVLGAHDSLVCHAARGENWLWHEALLLGTATGPVSFSVSFFNTGVSQSLEASTVCSGDRCGLYSSGQRHFGFIYSRPDANALLASGSLRPMPVLFKLETPDVSVDPVRTREALVTQLKGFLRNATFEELTKPYRRR